MSKKIKQIDKLELSDDEYEKEIDSVSDEPTTQPTPEEIIKINNKISGYVKDWIECDDKIKEYQAISKKLKEKKKIQEENIISLMNKYDVNDPIKISDGKIVKNISKTKTTLKQDVIESALVELIKNPEKAKIMTNFILEKRPTKEREYLKRVKNK